jgi:dGTPase
MSWLARREGWDAQRDDARDAAAIDYARIIHSASFRRLQGKTQILNLGDSDFYRTRLTHSLEVAQIAGGISQQLKRDFPEHLAAAYLPDLAMIQAVGATHDLGHPPFGHGGEVALNYCMREQGGFEGNGQTLRIVSRLESFSDRAGSNLTRRTMLGLLKYPAPYSRVANPEIKPRLDSTTTAIQIIDRVASKPPKCFLDSEQDVADWLLEPLSAEDRDAFTEVAAPAGGKHGKTKHKSFDCSIMDLADDIAFGVHDLEDALALKLIDQDGFRRLAPESACASFLRRLKERYAAEFGNDVYEGFVAGLFGEGGRRKRFIGRMVHHLITHCQIETMEAFDQPLVKYRAVLEPGAATFLGALKAAVRESVILCPEVQQLEFKGQKMVVSVFEALASEPAALLPRPTLTRYQKSEAPMRVICDHLSGMTDGYLLKTYDRLFSPRMGSVFDRL